MAYRFLRFKALLGGAAIVLAGAFVISFKFFEILAAGDGPVDGIFFPGAFFGGCFVGGIAFTRYKLRQLKQLETFTLAWYKQRYPALVLPNAVRCYRCRCSELTVRDLKNATYHREHTCSNCGTPLYYSPTH